MFVKPAENKKVPGTLLKVRRPSNHTLLPDEGAEVEENGFWLRAVRRGDVVRCDSPAETEAKQATKTKAQEAATAADAAAKTADEAAQAADAAAANTGA